MKIYNTFTKKSETFKPLNDGRVTIYACGITPQNHAHLGHAVAALRFSVIRRYLAHKGYEVQFVENITDIDDKIISRAKELGMTPLEVSQKYSHEYREELTKMGIPLPDQSPRVTEYIDKIIKYIQELINSKYAYTTPQGNVYFDVTKQKNYGELSGRRLDDELTGVRIELEQDKRNTVDFALWKADTTEGASWPSPWGAGRPGWHIECSVMSNDILGETIDIHCGGLDLLFPHHENEKAQCEAHNNVPFVKYWTHCGLLNVDGVKMSKSLGNFMTVRDGLERFGKELITWVILRHQYKSSIDMNDQLFRDNLNALRKFYLNIDPVILSGEIEISQLKGKTAKELVAAFEAEMDNDFNTSSALVLLSRYLEKSLELAANNEATEATCVQEAIVYLGRLLGIFHDYTLAKLTDELLKFQQQALHVSEEITVSDIASFIKERERARKHKDFAKSDHIRNLLLLHGVSVMDGTNNTAWEFTAN